MFESGRGWKQSYKSIRCEKDEVFLIYYDHGEDVSRWRKRDINVEEARQLARNSLE